MSASSLSLLVLLVGGAPVTADLPAASTAEVAPQPGDGLVLEADLLVRNEASNARRRAEEVVLDPEASTAERVEALTALTPHLAGDDLDLILRLSDAGPSAPLSPELRQPLFEAARALLERAPGQIDSIPQRATLLDSTAASPLVRAVALVGDEHAWPALDRLLGQDTHLDRVCLSSIQTLASLHPGTAPAQVPARVGAYLTEADSMLVRNALSALEALDAQDRHKELIAFLGHEDEGIRDEAFHALRGVTGLELPADAERWLQWLEDEEAWWLTESHDVFANLEGGEQSETLAALGQLTQHRLRRDEIAARILPLFELDSSTLQVAACEALGALGARAAAPVLRELADGLAIDDDVHAAAVTALATFGVAAEDFVAERDGSRASE